MAKCVARRAQQAGHQRRHLIEPAFTGNERVERGVAQKSQRQLHASASIPAWPLGDGDASDLRRRDREPFRVKRPAERERHDPIAIPAQLYDSGFDSRHCQRKLQPLGRAAGVNDQVRLVANLLGQAEADAESQRRASATGVDVHQLHFAAGDARRKPRGKAPHGPSPYDHDAIAQVGSAVPKAVERSLEVGREHGPLGRDVCRQQVDGG